jgi:hypothetical protein
MAKKKKLVAPQSHSVTDTAPIDMGYGWWCSPGNCINYTVAPRNSFTDDYGTTVYNTEFTLNANANVKAWVFTWPNTDNGHEQLALNLTNTLIPNTYNALPNPPMGTKAQSGPDSEGFIIVAWVQLPLKTEIAFKTFDDDNLTPPNSPATGAIYLTYCMVENSGTDPRDVLTELHGNGPAIYYVPPG